MAATTTGLGSGPFTDMISSIDRRCEFVENQAGANVRVNNFLTPTTLDNKSSILNAPCGYSNGVYASLRPSDAFGPELITNGDFATNSDFILSSATISNNQLTVSNGSNFLRQNNVVEIGKKYRIIVNIASQSTFLRLRVRFVEGGFENEFIPTVGENTIIATADGTEFRLEADGLQYSGVINSVSVKEVTNADFSFTRGSAATRVTKDGLIKNVQILSDDLVQNGDFSQIGSELVTNGDFATDSDWVKGFGWSINNGKATQDGTGNGSSLQQINLLVVGKTYKVKFEILEKTQGSLEVFAGFPNSNVPIVNTVGTHTFYLLAEGNTNLYFKPSNFIGSIDNVSVKEVGQNWENNFGSQWIIDGTKATLGIGLDGSYLRQANITEVGKKYKAIITTSGGLDNNNFVSLYGLNNYHQNIKSDGEHIKYFTADSTYFRFSGVANDRPISIDSISIIEVTDDTNLPRIDYTNGTGSLLLEPQSTNLVTYSENFTGWGFTSSSKSLDNSIVSPDGGSGVQKLTASSGSEFHFTNFSITISGKNSFSVFLKKGTVSQASMFLSESGNNGGIFDLQNGLVESVTGLNVSGEIINYGNGWFRCILNHTSTNDLSNSVRIGVNNGALSSFNANGDEAIYIWGAQLEALSYATSYIPTNGSTVTRNADVCNNAGSSDLINSTEGVLYAEISALHSSNIFDFGLYGNTSTNQLRIGFFNNDVYASLYNGSYQTQMSAPNDLSDFTKIAFKFKENDFALWINGNKVANDTIGTTFNSGDLVKLNLSAQNGTSSLVLGNVRSVAVFKEALTDEELAKITSTTQQEVFYEMRDKMLQINADYYEFGDYTTRLKKLF